MTFRLTVLILTLLAAAIPLEMAAQQKRWVSYEPETVVLEGKLVIEWKYGPPNFGERPRTDQRVRVPILVLTNPINVRGNPADANNALSVRDVRRIQLNFSDTHTSHKHLIGKAVVVKGTLFHAFTGHHYTHVLITVGSIERKAKVKA